jgi:hypothetical protein
MICKDCRPVFYAPGELGNRPTGSTIVKHIELCPRCEARAAEGALLAIAEEERTERRRYALFLGACIIYSVNKTDGFTAARSDAENGLMEIELREKREKEERR